MLNLSDKELDRFGKEAAQEYEPGDVLGPRSWERLEIRLDRDLGKVHPNPLRHIRRFPFYYATALLVLVGVSYYLVKQGRSGSPPARVVQLPTGKNSSSTSINSETKDKSTSTPADANVHFETGSEAAGAAAGSGAGSAAGNAVAGAGAGNGARAGSRKARTGNAGAGNRARTANGASAAIESGNERNGASDNGAAEDGAQEDKTVAVVSPGSAGRRAAGGAGQGTASGSAQEATGNSGQRTAANGRGRVGRGTRAAGNIAGNAEQVAGANGIAGSSEVANGDRVGGNGASGLSGNPDRTSGQRGNRTGSQARELGLSTIQSVRPTKKAAYISDSALRAFTLKSTPQPLVHKSGVHINRSLQLGVMLAPDFSSVNSLAGDKPGSTVGVTVDYQFASRWYIGSGLLLDRKNYAARSQDFHASPDFYLANNLQHIDFVKGTFEMLEIPLNLRYDFSVSGSTLFFASGGVSSYLLTSENNNFYTNVWGRNESLPYHVPNDRSYLFSAVNLSLGVETGLSNSMSLLIAPYMKIPVRNVGFGQVQMSSVGINFALKFAPVISRKRY